MSRIALITIVFCCAAAANGAQVVWTNVLGGEWSVAENWSPNQLPGTSDTALLTNDGNYTVIMDINPAISNLVVGGESGTQTLIKTGGQLTIQKPSDIRSRGVLNLSATLISTGLAVSGTVNWSGGTIASGSSLVVASNGLLNVTGATTKILAGLLTNQGTVFFTGQGAMIIGAAGALRNLSGSLLDFQTNSTIDGTGPVINHGTIRRSSDTGTVNVTVPCTNFGIVEVQHQSIGFAQLALGDGSSYTGPGLIPFGGGTLMGTITSENLVLMNGTLGGQGRLQGVLMWTNGSFGVSASLTVLSNGALISISSNLKTFNGSLTNEGKIVLSGGQITTGPSVVHNRANGLIEIQNILSWNIHSGATVINDGIIRKTAGTGTTFIGTATFSNRGTIDCQVGTLSFQTVLIEDGSSYIGTGTNAISSATMNGSFFSENIRLGSGLNGNGLLNGSMDWASGALASGASLTIASNSTLNIPRFGNRMLLGILTNFGTIVITNSAPTLSGSGAIYNRVNALIELHGDGVNLRGVINDGVIRKINGAGTSSVVGPFLNRGTLDCASGTISLNAFVNGVLADGSKFIGDGTVTFGQSGAVQLDGSIMSENLVVEGNSDVARGTGVVHGVVQWRKGTLTLGSLTVADDAILEVTGRLGLSASSVTNAGEIRLMTSGELSIHVSSRLHNLPGGIVELQSDTPYFVTGGGSFGLGPFINEGTVLKTAGVGTNTAASDVRFINKGAVSVHTGTVRFEGVLDNPTGTLEVQSGKITATTPLLLTNGLITGSGIIEAPSITSAATVSPGANNAVLTISGNYTQQLGGSIEFDIGGDEPGLNQSQVNITGDAKLNGTIGVRFSPGYSPEVGGSNVVLTAASLSGDFDCFNGLLLLGEDKRLTCSIASTNFVLNAISAPDPVQPTLNIAKDDQVLVCWPGEFVGYALRSNLDVGTTNWMVITGATNRFLEDASSPAKFFDLIKDPP